MIESLRERLEELRREVERQLEAASGPADVEEIRVRTLGKKGALTAEAKAIGSLPAGERRGRASSSRGEGRAGSGDRRP